MLSNIGEAYNISAGTPVEIKVYLRDRYGNNDLPALTNLAQDGLIQASIISHRQGNKAISVTDFQAITDDEDKIVLVSTANLTRAEYYRVSVILSSEAVREIPCTNCFIEVKAKSTPDEPFAWV